MTRCTLISDNYRRLNAELHADEATYGTTARRYLDDIRAIANKYRIRTILDYGCGKQDVLRNLGAEFVIESYDPAIFGLDTPPKPAEMVVCIDVLEHIEPEFLCNVLTDVARLTQRVALLTIATQSAGKSYRDGRNCHLIVKSGKWWTELIARYFRVIEIQHPNEGAFLCLVTSLASALKGIINS